MASHSTQARPTHTATDDLASSAILVLGYPRSGTTWLAKIFDSHPNVLYRHEPDEITQSIADISPMEQISAWIGERGLRSAGKRPVFQKSWRPPPLAQIRKLMMLTLAAAERLPIGPLVAKRFGLPDLIIPWRRASVRAAIKLVNWDGAAAARSMPNSRSCFIMRHPCGQIASVKAGMQNGLFRLNTQDQSPVDLRATMVFAAAHGVTHQAFNALSDAGKYAWSWRAFNETAVQGLANLPNAKIVIYEDLCVQTHTVAKDLFAFAGLSWDPQTVAFINQSTSHQQGSGYYDVFRSTQAVVDQWRTTLSLTDQQAVRAVARQSPLAHYWPDLQQP